VVNEDLSHLESRQYTPYGEVYGTTGTEQTAFGFTGEPVDVNGLVHLRARYYDPGMGRFFQVDPSRQEHNLYVYGLDNPVANSDPSGMVSEYTLTWDSYRELKYGVYRELYQGGMRYTEAYWDCSCYSQLGYQPLFVLCYEGLYPSCPGGEVDSGGTGEGMRSKPTCAPTGIPEIPTLPEQPMVVSSTSAFYAPCNTENSKLVDVIRADSIDGDFWAGLGYALDFTALVLDILGLGDVFGDPVSEYSALAWNLSDLGHGNTRLEIYRSKNITHYVYVVGDAAFTSLFFALLGRVSIAIPLAFALLVLWLFPEAALAAVVASVAVATGEILSILTDIGIDIWAFTLDNQGEGLFAWSGLKGKRIPGTLLVTPGVTVNCLQLGDA
jgi:RHS repeat-associated protein